MSDSVTQIEIEDVLSSIRRLVSEDARPRPARQPAGLQDRLVLTPSQRVESENGVPVAAPVNGAAADKPDTDDPQEPVAMAASVREEVARVVKAEDALPVDQAPAAQGSPLDAVARLVEKAVEQEVTAAFAKDDTLKRPEPADTAPEELAQDSAAEDPVEATPEPELSPLERKIAELEALIAQSSEEFEPDVQELGDNAPEELAQNEVAEWEPEDLEPDAPEEDSLTDLLNRTMAQDPVAEDDLDIPLIEVPEAEPEEAKIVDLSLVASAVKPDVEDEPSAPVMDNLGLQQDDESLSTEDEPEDDVAEPLEAGSGAQHAEETPQEEPTDPPEPARFVRSPHLTVVQDDVETLDADMLRSIVVQIVREELQSTLGERITRNVRKLVRREIQRAMMHHSLD